REVELVGRDGIGFASREHLGERALARAVGPHDDVHLTRPDIEIDTTQDLRPVAARDEIADPEQVLPAVTGARVRTHPTAPSRLMPSSFCASTANSIGSSLNTALQKPFTIIETASSRDRPRCMR